MINYNGKVFRAIVNTENGETSSETLFYYQQVNDILSANYAGGEVIKGHLLGKVDPNGTLAFYYHQINRSGELRAGFCHSSPELGPNGKIRLIERWQWLSGDQTTGHSIVEEL
jgi:hypothetical protein